MPDIVPVLGINYVSCLLRRFESNRFQFGGTELILMDGHSRIAEVSK